MKRIYRSTAAIALGWFIGSCGGGDAIVGPPPSPTTATVTMSAGTESLVPAATFQLTATAKSASGETLSRNFAWSTSAPATATVSSSGLVVGVAPGIATITAAVDGKSASATVTVLDGGVVSASGATLLVQSGAVQIVVPADAVASQTNLTVAVANGYATDPRVCSGTAFDFGPSGTTFQKPVSLKIKYDATKLPPGTEQAALKIHLSTSNGWLALPSSVDTAAKIVSTEVSHFSTYAVIIPSAVSAIVIRGPPDNQSGSPLQAGTSEQLTATLTDSNGQILTDRLVTWASSHPEIATVTSGGLVTAVAS
ncbi:MAG TPA: Ig-like domain-containing protein, partial [Gemmatimonadaceae bacterium]|nr:Ig-like domain-containing protein [Gemmatimonadaceae bacterium]